MDRIFVQNPGTKEEKVGIVTEDLYADALADPNFEEAAVFVDPDGNQGIVRKSLVKDYLGVGWKPLVEPKPLETGAKRGQEQFFQAQGWAVGRGPMDMNIDEVIASELHPVKFGIGAVGGIVLPAAAGGLAGAGGAKGAQLIERGTRGIRTPQGRSALATRVKAGAVGVKEGYQEGQQKPFIDLPIAKQIEGGLRGAVEGVRTYSVVKDIQKALGDETGSVGAPSAAVKPGIALIRGGESPIAKSVARIASTVGPTRSQTPDLEKLATMGQEARTEARRFSPTEAARTIVGDVDTLFKGFQRDKGAAFSELQAQARKEFWPAYAKEFRTQIGDRIVRLKDQKNPPTSVIKILESAQEVIETGKGSNPDIKVGAWNRVTNGDKFDRLQEGRRLIDQLLTPLSERNAFGSPVDAADAAAIKNLKEARDWIDSGLKRIPAKAKADQIYAEATDVYQDLFRGVKVRGEIDLGRLESMLTAKGSDGKRFKDRVANFSAILDKYGDEISPKEVGTFRNIIGRVNEMIDLAEQAKFVKGQGFVEGPTSSELQRFAARARRGSRAITEKGLPKDIIEAFPGSINSLDNATEIYREKYFGGRPVSKLSDQELTQIVDMHNWRQENPYATDAEEKRQFNIMMKRRK